MDSTAVFVFLAGFCFVKGAQVTVTPPETMVLPGQNATFMCRTGVPLQYCRVEIPGKSALNLNEQTKDPEVTYVGSGLNAGECGFMIRRVEEKNNGMVKFTLGIPTEVTELAGTANLVVARAPRAPILELSKGVDSLQIYKINDVLHASCIVRDGRPVANFSWFLNEEPLYNSELSMPTIVDMARDNLQSKIQNLSRVLQASDNGKFLRCVAVHPAYRNGRDEAQAQLVVKYGPQPQPEIHKFGYIVGQPGLITVIVEANPKPRIEWEIGGEKLREGENDQTGRLEAEEVKDLGNGRYDVSLRIAAIRKEDTEREYVLRAYNDMNSYDYRIMISTSPEPEGIELGIGGIIGIVAAILIILFSVFLLIFAKVTGRWCFSDGATVIDYTTGDSGHHVTSDGVSGDGVDNPHHQVSQEYINGNDVKKGGEKEKKINTEV